MDELNQKLKLLKLGDSDEQLLTLEATVPTGLEVVAISEINEKIGSSKDPTFVPGRIYWNIAAKDFANVLKLRSIDNLSLFVDLVTNLDFKDDKEHDLNQIANILLQIDLRDAAKTWSETLKFKGNYAPTRVEHDEARVKQDKVFHNKKTDTEFDPMNGEYLHNILKYRVTCERSGLKHSFTSNEAAYKLGGEINNQVNWIVALSDWDLNLLLRISGMTAMVLLKLTVQSMHRRCLICFGPTSLRPTIAYSMLRLAEIKPGDHVMDPLCGGGSIPIECMHEFPESIITCGDNHDKAVARALTNIHHQPKYLQRVDVFRWDSTNLLFRNHSIDVIVTDLPFGKRSGSKRNNARFYRQLVDEFARVLRLGSGRMVILTQDSPHLFKALHYREPSSIWFISKILSVNVGALKCSLVVAWRKKRSPYLDNSIPTPIAT